MGAPQLSVPGKAVLSMILSDAVHEFRRLSALLEQGLTTLREQGIAYAEFEAAYRRAQAEAWLKAPEGGRGGTPVAERESWVKAETADHRKQRDIADALRLAALEAVRSRRGQISALQSLLAADRAEAEFARTGPRVEP